MTLEELRAVRAGGPGFCGPDTFNELTRLAEERLLLEQKISRVLFWHGSSTTDRTHDLLVFQAMVEPDGTLGAAIRKAAGVSDAR